MEGKKHLHNYLKKGTTFIYLITAIISCVGLILDALKTNYISSNIIYINLITCGIIMPVLILFLFRIIDLPTGFAITVYSLVTDFIYGFLTISYGKFEEILFLRNSFFLVYLMILTYIIVNKSNGIIYTLILITFIIYGTIKIDNQFLWDSLILFISVLTAFSGVTYYLINLFEKNTYELLSKNIIIEKQNSELNETNVLLEERQQQIEEQSEELTEQKRQLAEINSELNELVATKDKFFSIIAHDLKNPINALMGYSELLYAKFDRFDEEKRYEMLQIIHNSSKSINNLIENLLIWSRMQTGRIKENLTGIILYNSIKETDGLLKSMYSQKKIKMSIDLDKNIEVKADKYMLSSVIYNLMLNAIKFTDNEGTITISAEKDKKGYVRTCVADTGVGIAEKDIPKLFRTDLNYSTKGTNQEKGTGLGLILCKEFIEKQGGEIWVESEKDKGSQFYFTLPLYKDK